ncbi:hypothetical protein FIBSPDRAFT_949697 [Athelia psychrophila]|uniref:Uncharacterized protein n=1 Tax=Athelia psychrophila TaxID=1759441 RepID=A0A166PLU1_9AGAM|nr:hypothetical protein FIBSPDRAFT_949697 [Fibularhizoctonia sp. CBS 109695]
MSIDNANALLWQRDALPKTAFSAFKRAILQELSVRNGLIIGRTGKTGNTETPIKRAHIEIERYIPTSVMVRIYQAPKDWKHVLEDEVILESNGDLCLDKVPRPDDCRGECRVIDPRNYAPFFAYQPGHILAGDLSDLLDEGYLRVVYLKPK